MRYRRIILQDFKGFRASRIERFEAQLDAHAVHFILGPNGSGKSRLLKALNPSPPTKPSFGPKGYKLLDISHDGHDYTIVSDFSKKSHAHSFVQDGVELNESGTSNVQEELVKRWFGWSNVRQAIVSNSLRFTKLSASERRAVLMATCPGDMGFILARHKTVNQSLKSIRANLTMLYERRMVLENQRLPDEVITSLEEEKESLTSLITDFIRFESQAQEMQRHVGSFTAVTEETHKELHNDIAAFCAAWRKDANRLKDVDRLNPDAEKQNLMVRRGELRTLADQQRRQIAELRSMVDRHQQRLDEIKDVTSVADLIAKRDLLEKDIKTLRERNPQKLITDDDLNCLLTSHAWMDTLQGYLAPLLDNTAIKPWSKETWVRKQRQLDRRRYQHRDIERQYQAAEARAQAFYQKKRTPDITIPKHSACGQCPLLQKFQTAISDYVNEQQHVDTTVARTKRRYTRSLSWLTAAQAIWTTQNLFHQKLEELAAHIRTLPSVWRYLQDQQVSKWLVSNPFRAQTLIVDAVDITQSALQLDAKEVEFTAVVTTLAGIETRDTGEAALLGKLVDENTSTIKSLLDTLSRVDNELNYTAHALDALDRWQNLSQWAQRLNEASEKALHAARKTADRAVLDLTLNLLKEGREHATVRLGDISRTLQEQAALTSRYSDEVLANITRLEAERDELAFLEQSLSPITGIPHQFIVEYLNSVLNAANAYIPCVIHTPFSLTLDLVDDTASLDYMLSARVDDVPIADISECSDAQMDVIDLAINIALMAVLGLHDYSISLDEVGRSFDHYHKHRLLDLLMRIIEQRLCEQMFIVNHSVELHQGLGGANTIVLSTENIVVPEDYNTTTSITHYT